jgi:signal transduction histidine kinase
MEHVARGSLNARIPIVGRGDDVDLLSHDINDALARLAATVESMRQVSADIAHDLKSPLNRLKMTIDEALAKQESGQAVIAELEAASAEADRINETFEALLRIAQIEAGARRSRFGRVDLGDILQSLADIYSSVAEDNGQRLKSSLDQPGEFILGDRELLTQMYANLIENAIRHCPAGTYIVIRSEANAERITTYVEDDGPGIPDEEHGNVFRRLYRLEKSRTSPGSGLGLSLVKAIADLHGARILMEDSEPGLRIKIVFARVDQ